MRTMTTREQQISDSTAFDQGDAFADADAVRAYFTAAEMTAMFGEDAITDQDELGAMAADVIAHRWHMVTAESDA